MFRKVWQCSFLVFSLASVSFAQVKLEPKYREGATLSTEASVKMDQTLTIMGSDVVTSAAITTTAKSAVGQRDGEGQLRIENKVEALKVNINAMGMEYVFDSADPDKEGTSQIEIIRTVHKALAGRTTTTVLGKDNRVAAIESDQDILSTLPAELQQAVKSEFDLEYAKEQANQEIDRLPTDPVNKGDTWDRTGRVNFGQGQIMTFQVRYTYEGTTQKAGKTLDKITAKSLSVIYSLENSPLPFTVKESSLKIDESSGVILFDRELGRVVEAAETTRVRGDLTFVVNNTDLPSKLDLKVESATITK